MRVALSDIGAEPAPLRWSSERYLTLIESGVIPEGRGVELIDGQVILFMPQGKLHNLLFLALQQAFRRVDFGEATIAAQTTLVMTEGNTFDPEFALLRAQYEREELPRPEDVLWVVEVAVTSRDIDLGPKKHAYAAARIPEYWVVDALKRGVWTFTEPADGEYRRAVFTPAGSSMTIPFIGAPLDTGAIFPKPRADESRGEAIG